jgi:ABC-type branched-subunit amino acid transport system substrate-binding protein
VKNLIARLEAIQQGGPQLVAALLGVGALSGALLLAAVVGAFTIDGGGGAQKLSAGSTTTGPPSTDAIGNPLTSETTADPNVTVPGGGPATTAKGAKATATTVKGATATTAKPGGGSNTTTVTEAPPLPGEQPLPKGGNATGVSDTEIKYGVHVPLTFNKAPVPLGGPVARGIRTYVKYLNDNGGINGRKVKEDIQDDEFTTGGADTAGKTLINQDKNFFVAGTLGVDQIAVVADLANKAKVPYFAGGGNEPQFQNLNIHQILSTYDTHVTKLAQYMGKDPKYAGKKVGVIVSDTTYIFPSVTDIFRDELKKNGLELVQIEKVQKPEDQSAKGYGTIITNFKGKGVQVVVPLTDPINTSGLVRECQAQLCSWDYSFSDFAHDGETALALMADTWGSLHVRGLSGGCYANAPADQMNNPAKCGSLGKAKAQFEAVKGAGSWTATQNDNDGTSAGYNSAAGYQWIGFWLKAMKDLGTEVTRERLVASINRYEGYNDLVTGPITYKNGKIAHGADKMTVFEAQSQAKYKMITDGMVDGF